MKAALLRGLNLVWNLGAAIGLVIAGWDMWHGHLDMWEACGITLLILLAIIRCLMDAANGKW